MGPSGFTPWISRTSVPSGAMVASVPLRTKAIREPSGDQVGQRLSPSRVICRRPVPSLLITKICPGTTPPGEIQNASLEPSGDQTRSDPPKVPVPHRRATSSRRSAPSGPMNERTFWCLHPGWCPQRSRTTRSPSHRATTPPPRRPPRRTAPSALRHVGGSRRVGSPFEEPRPAARARRFVAACLDRRRPRSPRARCLRRSWLTATRRALRAHSARRGPRDVTSHSPAAG
jgi:hypothetical protein